MPAGRSKKTGSSRSNSKISKRKARTTFMARHVDQVFDDFVKDPSMVHDGSVGPVGSNSKAALDDDLPGGGKFYCIACSKYFVSEQALKEHCKTKPHKRRVAYLLKLKKQGMKPHNGLDAEIAAGMAAPDNGRGLLGGGEDGDGALMMAE